MALRMVGRTLLKRIALALLCPVRCVVCTCAFGILLVLLANTARGRLWFFREASVYRKKKVLLRGLDGFDCEKNFGEEGF